MWAREQSAGLDVKNLSSFLPPVGGLLTFCKPNLSQFLHLENKDNDPDFYKGV